MTHPSPLVTGIFLWILIQLLYMWAMTRIGQYGFGTILGSTHRLHSTSGFPHQPRLTPDSPPSRILRCLHPSVYLHGRSLITSYQPSTTSKGAFPIGTWTCTIHHATLICGKIKTISSMTARSRFGPWDTRADASTWCFSVCPFVAPPSAIEPTPFGPFLTCRNPHHASGMAR